MKEGIVKTKLSATVDAPLIRFLDSLPGKTRSEKLERALSILQKWEEERQLRHDLAAYNRNSQEDHKDQKEREDWEHLMEEAMWSE